MPDETIRVPKSDPLYQAWIWRQDSALLFTLRPILARLEGVVNMPCRVGPEPYACLTEGLVCSPCAVRQIKTELFGEEKT